MKKFKIFIILKCKSEETMTDQDLYDHMEVKSLS
jgi:hypothetical protein